MFIFYPVNTSLQRLLCEIPPRGSKQEKKNGESWSPSRLPFFPALGLQLNFFLDRSF